MSDKHIEARLERSLRAQVVSPRLDGRFNAAVWQRVAAEQAPAPPRARASTGPRWLMVSNIVGVVVSLVLLVYVLLPRVGSLPVQVEFPTAPPEINVVLLQGMGWGIAVLALAVSFAFTSKGRRWLHSLRNF